MTTLQDELGARFEPTLQAEADSRGRLTLSRAGARPGRRYQVYTDSDGVLVLVPVVTIPEREMIVWRDPDLTKTLIQGIEDARDGNTADLGDFTKHLDEEDSDE